MRKGALILLIVVALLAGLIYFFTQDRYIESALEGVGEAVAGARVEIDNFSFSLFGLRASWDRLQVANRNNPWRNIIETGPASLDFELRPLFWNRVIIEEVSLLEVRSGSKRTTDGTLPAADNDRTRSLVRSVMSALDLQVVELPSFDVAALGKTLKLDSLINVENLYTVQQFKRLRVQADSSLELWQSQLSAQPYLQRVQDIRQSIDSLQVDQFAERLQQADLLYLTQTLDRVNAVQSRVTTLRDEIDTRQQALRDDFTGLQNQVQRARGSLQEDIERAKRLASLQGLDVENIATMLFGRTLLDNIERILAFVARARAYMPVAQELFASNEPEAPPRLEGQNIRYPFHYRYPRFLIRKITLSGMTAAGDSTRGYAVNGLITGLTNEPPVLGQPARFQLQVGRQVGNQYELRGTLDHTGKVAHDSLWITARNFGIGRIRLAQHNILPTALELPRGDIALAGRFIGKSIAIDIDLDATSVQFRFADSAQTLIARSLRDVLAGIDRLDLGVRVRGDDGRYTLGVKSNVDNLLAARVKGLVDEKLQDARARLEAQVRAEIDQRQQQVQALIASNQERAGAELAKAEALVREQRERLEAARQQLQTRIDEEKKKAGQLVDEQKKKAEEEAKKALGGLLKKKKDEKENGKQKENENEQENQYR